MGPQGPLLPGSGTNDATVGTFAWTNPGNITLDDGTNATATRSSAATSNYLVGSNYGFTIPAGSIINGIVVESDRQRSEATGQAIDSRVVIRKSDGTFGSTNKAVGTNWPTVQAFQLYGGVSDLWGETWSSSDINDIDFGIGISVAVSPDVSCQARVDTIRITVYYTDPQGGFNIAFV